MASMWTNGSNEQEEERFSEDRGHVQEGNALEGEKWQKTLDSTRERRIPFFFLF